MTMAKKVGIIKAPDGFYIGSLNKTGLPSADARKITDDEINIMVDKCSRGGKITLGAMEVLAAEDMRKIYQIANK